MPGCPAAPPLRPGLAFLLSALSAPVFRTAHRLFLVLFFAHSSWRVARLSSRPDCICSPGCICPPFPFFALYAGIVSFSRLVTCYFLWLVAAACPVCPYFPLAGLRLLALCGFLPVFPPLLRFTFGHVRSLPRPLSRSFRPPSQCGFAVDGASSLPRPLLAAWPVLPGCHFSHRSSRYSDPVALVAICLGLFFRAGQLRWRVLQVSFGPCALLLYGRCRGLSSPAQPLLHCFPSVYSQAAVGPSLVRSPPGLMSRRHCLAPCSRAFLCQLDASARVAFHRPFCALPPAPGAYLFLRFFFRWAAAHMAGRFGALSFCPRYVPAHPATLAVLSPAPHARPCPLLCSRGWRNFTLAVFHPRCAHISLLGCTPAFLSNPSFPTRL